MKFERILDPTARIPGQVYVCSFHCGFSPERIEGAGHYPALPNDVKCSNCVEWEHLCDKWIQVGDPMYGTASVRCMLRKGHDRMHLVDDLDGSRFSWGEDSFTAVREQGPPADVFVNGVKIGTSQGFTLTVNSGAFNITVT